MIQKEDIVRGNFWPETVQIKAIHQITNEFYSVEAIGKKTSQYYERMLEREQLDELIKVNKDTTSSYISNKMLKNYLEYNYFETGKATSVCRAFGNKQVIPLPHQIQAIYGNMLKVPQVRYLLADDPGAGKTIMAGMLIKELIARNSIERVLILVPPIVLKQWQEELKDKFGIEFRIITRGSVTEAAGRNPFEEYPLCLTSIYWGARVDIKDYLLQADYDLIIVDEAHKMAAYTEGKKKKKIKRTKIYQLGESLLRNTEHRLLLTATPHKGDTENYRHLLKLVDEDIFSNPSQQETLREKSNPFVIRRLKEQMVNFDGTPIFPTRETKTVEFTLSRLERELYKEVTEYVTEYFNRAEQRGNRGTSFAMMLLQRRLSSSVEAIYKSLVRRLNALKKKLIETTNERQDLNKELQALEIEGYSEESYERQQELEAMLELSIDAIDLEELQKEIDMVAYLERKADDIRKGNTDRKYEELERTLFGPEGLINRGEKILIFTEAVDTLKFLEGKLKQKVGCIAKIIGEYDMSERRNQVKLFRDEAPIMLATDAGGESINLQFCNQMINYDIPWNPNKLEQRMGRIHRIGQKNNVVVFNLVAKETREGQVMSTLLAKMEQMKKDIGKDLVFDFIGDILEDNDLSLADLMEEAIRNRINLDELIAKMEKILSEEHIKLIRLAEEEQLDEQSFDLPGMRTKQNQLILSTATPRMYGEFTKNVLEDKDIKVFKTGANYRVERLPKMVRDFAKKKLGMSIVDKHLKYKIYQQTREQDDDSIPVIETHHPLFKLAIDLVEEQLEKIVINQVEMLYPTREELYVEIYQNAIVDGKGREVRKELKCIGINNRGEYLEIDPYFMEYISNEYDAKVIHNPCPLKAVAYNIKQCQNTLFNEKVSQGQKLDKKIEYLKRSFDAQYEDTTKKLEMYRENNIDNRNSALINQMRTRLLEIEQKKQQRLEEIEREKSLQLVSPKCISRITLTPDDTISKRIVNHDYDDIVMAHELTKGNVGIKRQKQFGLVDFYSETVEGIANYILVIENLDFEFSQGHKQDLSLIKDNVVIYYVNDRCITKEIRGVELEKYL